MAGLAPTAQRRLVLTAPRGREHPASAIEIHQRLRVVGQAVGSTTVYRTPVRVGRRRSGACLHRDEN
ncbi:hypothetical protein AAH979_35735 [Plantactinospora sp. ZYX-F-223]|uniref:hypothetical protein n=1 Tax=Plantactinospora sp. ZYX-F-223 TaxID=3144103 RepID=UPI0031FCBF2A